MALVNYYTCDHCGKRLDSMKDFPDSVVDVCYSFIEADLCADCVKELADIVLRFARKERKGDDERT